VFSLRLAHVRPTVAAEEQHPFVLLARTSPAGLELSLDREGDAEEIEAGAGPAGQDRAASA
jgi:hypothetical protein